MQPNQPRPELHLVGVAVLLFAALTSCKSTVQHVELYPDGAKLMEGSLVGGLQEGLWTHYYENGRKNSEGQCRNDLQVGKWTFWHPDGSVDMEGSFDDGVQVGEWCLYHDADGPLRARGEFVDGLEHGFWQFFSEGGLPLKQGFFDHQRCSYGWSEWYEDGSPKASGMYLEGDKVGPWTYYEEDGSVRTKVYDPPLDRSGRPFEIVMDYWDEGTLQRRGLAQGGLPIGGWTTWHASGAPRSAGLFVAGKAKGTWTFWTDDGSALARGLLESSRPVGEWTVTENGETKTKKMDSSRPPAVFTGSWSDADLAEQSVQEAVGTWLVEASSPSRPYDPSSLANSAAPNAELEGSVAAQEGVDVPYSPHSPDELEKLDDYIAGFTDEEGARKVKESYAGDGDLFDDVPTASGDTERINDLVGKTFTNKVRSVRGQSVEICDGKRNTLVVIFKGIHDGICVYCTAQLRAYLEQEAQLERLNTRVCYMYPGSADSVVVFEEMYCRKFGDKKLPCDLVLDTQHKFISEAGIVGDLARPTTMILDPNGVVRWAYVGEDDGDRPSMEKILEALSEIGPGVGGS